MNMPLILRETHMLELCPRAPLNFDATMHKPAHFPSSDNAWEPGARWQTMFWDGQALGLKLEGRGKTDQPKLGLSIWSKEKLSPAFVESLTDEIEYRLCLQTDLSGFNRAFEKDALLGPMIEKWRGMRPVTYSSLYEYLIIAIVLQNATVRRSVNMMQALYEKYGTLLAFDGRELFCFWAPEIIDRATEQELRGLKVGYRAKSIKRITEAFVKKQIDENALRTKTIDEQ
ncbi:MAG: hypothetical protein A2147_05510, partial [Chloroflexi bacterium RBG_16_57_8]